MSKTYYNEKLVGVSLLIKYKGKNAVKDAQIEAAAKQAGLPAKSLKKAWVVFQETGGSYVDKRYKEHSNNTVFKCTPTVKATCKFNPSIDTYTAGNIIKEYMSSDLNSREIANKYNISLNQFYSWIHELTISGKLLGRTVLKPSKYDKLPVIDVIWLRKKPHSTRKSIKRLSTLKRQCYQRVADVLEAYL